MFCSLNIGKQNVTTGDDNHFCQSMLLVNKISYTYAATILKHFKIIYRKKLSSCFLSFNAMQENEKCDNPRKKQLLIRACFLKTDFSTLIQLPV